MPTILTEYGDLMPQLSIAFATNLADGFTVVQEWMAVTFHLVCLSRLETTADIKSCMVLFLTLVVFTGPYLNAWLLYTDHIFFKELSNETFLRNFLLGVLIAGAHVLGSFTASAIVRDWQSKSNSTIKWELTPTEQEKDNDLSTHVLEEMFAVASLLIGCVYLLWLKKMRNDKPEKDNEKGIPRIEIRFYFQLTLLVAAVSQAFPDAYLSPHVACYKIFMNRISVAVLLCRLCGGAVGFLISCIWCILRVNYRNGVQIVLPDEHEQKTTTNYKSGYKPLTPAPQTAEMPGFRLSMHGLSYF
jgi:hypothetical protein